MYAERTAVTTEELTAVLMSLVNVATLKEESACGPARINIDIVVAVKKRLVKRSVSVMSPKQTQRCKILNVTLGQAWASVNKVYTATGGPHTSCGQKG